MKEMMNMPERKLIDHRGPMCVDVRGAWYFITVCAEGHREWPYVVAFDRESGEERIHK